MRVDGIWVEVAEVTDRWYQVESLPEWPRVDYDVQPPKTSKKPNRLRGSVRFGRVRERPGANVRC